MNRTNLMNILKLLLFFSLVCNINIIKLNAIARPIQKVDRTIK